MATTARRKLTKRDIDRAKGPSAKGPKAWAWLGDGEVSGFGVKLYGNGRKVFALRYRTARGRHRMLTIGEYGALTVQQARDAARAEKVRILDGADPQAEREEAREPVRVPTVKALMTEWLDNYAKAHRRRWAGDERRINARIIPALGRLRLEDVTAAKLSRWHRASGESSPVEANRCIETLRAAWRWAEAMEMLPAGAPASTLFGRRKVKRFRERSRDRWLREDEVKRLMDAAAKHDDVYVRALVPLYLLTGLRKREWLDAQWSDVDLDRGEIRLPMTKTGEPQTRLIPPAAVVILRDLPRVAESDCVFPSPADPSKPRDDFKKPWNAIRKAAKLPDITLHDLRRTAGSWLAQRGTPIEVIQKLLGHSHPSVTKLYARLASENERKALDTLSDALAGPLGLNGKAAPAEEPDALPDRLRALLADAENDPAALAAGLRALALAEWTPVAEA